MRHYQVAGVGLLAGALALVLGGGRAGAADHPQASPPTGPARAGEQGKAAGARKQGAACPCENAAGGQGQGEPGGLPGWSPSIDTTPGAAAPRAGGFGAGLAEQESFAIEPLKGGACGEGATGPAGAAGGASFGAGIGGAGGHASEAPFMLGPLPSTAGGAAAPGGGSEECATCAGEHRP
jgi:hypothetical protein